MRIRVATFPDWRRDNPYQRLLAEALAPLGVKATFPRGYRRGLPLSRQVLKQPRPDVLHLHWPTPYLRSGRTALRAAYCLRTLGDVALVRRAGIPVVWTVHNLVTHDTPTPRLERWFSARLARLADRLIVHSEAAANEVVAVLGATQDKIAVIPHGSFSPAYGPAPLRAEARAALDLPMDVPVALFFGMIRPYKGVLNLLRAWAALGELRGDAFLVIAGDAPDPDHTAEIRRLAEESSGVRLDLRRIPDAEVPILMAAADLLVLPFESSLTSGTVRLAQDYGRPVVVPRVPGAADASSAIMAESTDPDALGAAILRGLRTADEPLQTPAPPNDWPRIAATHRSVYAMARGNSTASTGPVRAPADT